MLSQDRVLKVGDRALWDSLTAGMVPCCVESIEGASGWASTQQRVSIKLTASRGVYRAGESLSDLSALWVVPQSAYRRGEFSGTICAYRVEVPTS